MKASAFFIGKIDSVLQAITSKVIVMGDTILWKKARVFPMSKLVVGETTYYGSKVMHFLINTVLLHPSVITARIFFGKVYYVVCVTIYYRIKARFFTMISLIVGDTLYCGKSWCVLEW